MQYVSQRYLTPYNVGFGQLQQERMADYIKDIEEAIGKEAVRLIVEEAQNGKISIKTAGQLATELGRKDETVKGEFKRRVHSGDAIDGAEVKHILSDWWNFGGGCNEDDPKSSLLRALKEVKLSALVTKLQKLEAETIQVAWKKAETREGNNNESSDRLLEDRVKIEVLSQPPRTNSYQRSCSREGALSNWQKVKSELKKLKSGRCKKRWFFLFALVAVFLPSFLFWYTKFGGSSFDSDSTTVTRSVRIGNSRNALKTVTELVTCPTQQSSIPDLPAALVGHVGLLIREDQILVCGGTNDQGYDARTCITFTLKSQNWVAFNHTMNKPRIHSHAKINGEKVFIIGGDDSHPIKNCRESQEVFDLESPHKGWQLEPLPSGMDNVCFPSEVVLEIQCI